MGRPSYLIRTSQLSVEEALRITGGKIDRECPLFEHTLVEVKPLPPPAGKIFHIKYRYGQRDK